MQSLKTTARLSATAISFAVEERQAVTMLFVANPVVAAGTFNARFRAALPTLYDALQAGGMPYRMAFFHRGDGAVEGGIPYIDDSFTSAETVAAINTMFASVESRSVEIGTLRALGFQGLPIVMSVVLESMVLCLAGGVLGGAAAWLGFNGHVVSTVNGASFTQIAFAFSVSPGLLAQGIAVACAIGLAGGLPPALRAVRIPIVEALRAS